MSFPSPACLQRLKCLGLSLHTTDKALGVYHILGLTTPQAETRVWERKGVPLWNHVCASGWGCPSYWWWGELNGQGRGRQKRWSGPRLLQIPFLNINDSNDHIGVCNVKKIPQYWKQSPVLPWDDGESHPQNKSRSSVHISPLIGF